MKPIIPDASLVCKLYFDEGEESALAKTLPPRWSGVMIAPDLLLVEVASNIYRRLRDGEFSRAEAEGFVADLRMLFPRAVPVLELFDAAWKMSLQLPHPPADCVYLALAERQGGTLATADQKFLRKVKNSQWEKFAAHLRDLV